jgi:hypothetical protein
MRTATDWWRRWHYRYTRYTNCAVVHDAYVPLDIAGGRFLDQDQAANNCHSYSIAALVLRHCSRSIAARQGLPAQTSKQGSKGSNPQPCAPAAQQPHPAAMTATNMASKLQPLPSYVSHQPDDQVTSLQQSTKQTNNVAHQAVVQYKHSSPMD